jgi:hypothetical protein
MPAVFYVYRHLQFYHLHPSLARNPWRVPYTPTSEVPPLTTNQNELIKKLTPIHKKPK